MNKKQPLRSLNGYECLTPCTPKGEVLVHPTLLQDLKNYEKNVCAIDGVYTPGVDLSASGIRWMDECALEDNNFFDLPSEEAVFSLNFSLDSKVLLRQVYDLQSMEEIINWTNDSQHPYYTVKRIHNCGWKVYGQVPDEMTGTVLDYYYRVATRYWLPGFLRRLAETHSFAGRADQDLTAFFTPQWFNRCVFKYIKANQEIWETIASPYTGLREYLYQQVTAQLVPT